MERQKQIAHLLIEAFEGRVADLRKSIETAHQALRLCELPEDLELKGDALNKLSLFHMIVGEHEKSIHFAQEAIRIFEELGNPKGLADAKYNIAGVYYKTDNYHLGMKYLVEARIIYQDLHDSANLSRTEKSLATIYEYFGDEKNAERCYRQAIDEAHKVGDQNLESNAYNNLSGIYLKQNRIAEALDLVERSIEMKSKTGDIRGIAFAYYGRGKVYAAQEKYEAAEDDFKRALEIHIKVEERLGLGMVYCRLGALYYETGRLDLAWEYLQEGLKHSKKYHIAITTYKCHLLLYKFFKTRGNIEAALTQLEEYQRIKNEVTKTQTFQIIENYELIGRMHELEAENRMQKEKAEIMEKKNLAENLARQHQDFLSTMSHEIRTPLNAIINIIELLKNENEEGKEELMQSLEYSSQNLMMLIQNILDFNKLDAGKAKLHPHPVLLSELLENLCHSVEHLGKSKGLKIETHIDALLKQYYLVDQSSITHILINLLSNAIKFTDVGMVRLEATVAENRKDQHKVRFSIIDTGIGIARENLYDIFDSYSQVQPVTTKKHGGTGLGLAIVKKLVELHGSKIEVESTPGKGTTFSFQLDLTLCPPPAERHPTHVPGLKWKKVLLAEDNKINALVASKVLGNLGMQVYFAANGQEAVNASNEQKFDIILMDIHMPVMNGFEAAKAIRITPNVNNTTPILGFTADVTAINDNKFSQYFDDFLFKPLDPVKAMDIISRILGLVA